MENTLYVGLTRQLGLRRVLDVTANNLANANTDSFKAERTRFHDLVEQLDHVGNVAFTSTVNISRDLQDGAVRTTGNPLDFAIHGPGYFAIETNRGTAYTRYGRFSVNANNELVTVNGDPVQDTGGRPILLPARSQTIEVSGDGLIEADGEAIAQMAVFRFEDERRMEKIGENLYLTDEQPLAVVSPGLVQRALEGSNVNPVNELISLISVQREYTSMKSLLDTENRRALESIDKLMRTS